MFIPLRKDPEQLHRPNLSAGGYMLGHRISHVVTQALIVDFGSGHALTWAGDPLGHWEARV